MKIAVGMLSHNPIANMRFDLFEQTKKSLQVAFPDDPMLVFGNGCTDGSEDFCDVNYISTDGDHSPGRGCRELGDHLYRTGAELLVMSDDDMIWRPEARETLVQFWLDGSLEFRTAILCAYLEPDFSWSKPLRTIDVGGVRAIVRESAPSCAWTLNRSKWMIIRNLIEDGFGHDFKVCQEIRASNFEVAQIDLATHAGWGRSTYGNSANPDTKSINRKLWGV